MDSEVDVHKIQIPEELNADIEIAKEKYFNDCTYTETIKKLIEMGLDLSKT